MDTPVAGSQDHRLPAWGRHPPRVVLYSEQLKLPEQARRVALRA